MATNNATYSNLTNHHNTFKDSYWGNFPFAGYNNNYHIDDNIINNRNEFIKDYNIIGYNLKNINYRKLETDKNRLKNEPKPSCCSNVWDHSEHYITKNKKRIMIVSPYTNVNSQENILEIEQYFSKFSFLPYNKLYSKYALTFIREF